MYYWILVQYASGYTSTYCICDGKAEANARFEEYCSYLRKAWREQEMTVRMVTPAFPWNSKTIWIDIEPKNWPSVKERKFTKSE